MMRSRPALHADRAGGLLADAPQLHGCDIHAVWPGTGGARVTEARSRARVPPRRGQEAKRQCALTPRMRHPRQKLCTGGAGVTQVHFRARARARFRARGRPPAASTS
jgi:hypothetical protein